ncbi:radical SAM/SPASM domain-containing protein [Calditrichota bacterium]
MLVPLKSIIKSFFIFRVKYTPKRILNMLKIYSSMYLSKIFRKQIIWGYPLYLMIEPTNICNLKCPMCPSGNGDMKREFGKLDFDTYKKILDEIGEYVIQIQLWNQGEPFINKSFLDFVRYAKTKSCMTQTSTNGHYIRTDEQAEEVIKSGLDQLIFSMDGTNKESYEKYRIGGNFDLVIETLERLARAKKKLKSKTPLIELQFVIFKHNEKEFDDLIELAKKNNVNRISFKTAQVYSAEQAEVYLPENIEYSRYNFDGRQFEMRGEIKNWCNRLWLNSTINWEGSITPCCFDKDSDYAFENITKNGTSFKNTWKNKGYLKFRKNVMTNRKSIPMCLNCNEGLKDPYTKIVEISDL